MAQHRTTKAARLSQVALSLMKAGRAQRAVAAFDQVIAAKPDDAVAYFNRAGCLTQLGQHQAAAQDLLQAVRLDPGFAAAWVNLASRLQVLGQTIPAYDAAQLAVQLGPHVPHAFQILGSVLYDMGQFGAAIRAYMRAASLGEAPGFRAVCLTNLGRALEAAGNLAGALEAAEAALALNPALAEAALGRATALLAAGRYQQGWPAYQARWGVAGARRAEAAGRPWRGEALAGASILLDGEQGLGDMLQFARFAPQLAARGARVTLRVPQPLVRLMRSLGPDIDVVATETAVAPTDFYAALMDVAEFLAPDIAALAPAHAYLHADPALMARHKLPPGAGLRVGLVWAGDPRPGLAHAHIMDRRRSLPLAALAPLSQAGRARFYSLQLGMAGAQTPPEGLDLIDLTAGITDFADTAAMVAQLDLVITVDTSMAHLAASLGRPTWLLSRFDACWRWMRGRSDSPWYPTMRIFRQASPGAWGPVVDDVSRALTEDRKTLLF